MTSRRVAAWVIAAMMLLPAAIADAASQRLYLRGEGIPISVLSSSEPTSSSVRNFDWLRNDDPGVTLRLVVGPGGVGLAPDSPSEEDEEFKEPGGQTVLIVAQDLGDKLSEVTMDVQDTEEGPKLSIG